MSAPTVRIRPGTSADLEAVIALVRELAAFERAEGEVTARIEDYSKDFMTGWFEMLVAESDGRIVGMALGHRAYSTWKGRMFWLDDLIVTESWRGQGIGGLLFEGMICLARERGARLFKWQVLDWNTDAHRFYRRYDANLETDWWNGKIHL